MRRLVWGGGVALAGVALAWFSFAFAASLVSTGRGSHGFGYETAGEMAKRASLEIAGDLEAGPSRAKARNLASAALLQEPVSANAARVLGFVASQDGQEARALRLMRYAESLSRRDVGTQLWLLEYAVKKGDIADALRHYDIAMRTSVETRATLLPILVSAAADPSISTLLADRLAQRPAWWRDFLDRFIADNVRPPAQLAYIIASLKLRPDVDEERGLLSFGMSRLIEAKAYPLARKLFVDTTKDRHALQNGDFEADRDLPPFAWIFATDADLGAFRERGDDAARGNVLRFTAAAARGGEVARQFLTLPAGKYRIQLAGSPPAKGTGEISLRLQCVDGRSLGEQALLASTLSLDVDVPADCPAQSLVFAARGLGDGLGGNPWVDDVTIKRHS